MLTRRTLIRGSLAVGLAAPAVRRSFAKTGQALRIGYILPVQSQLGAGATTFADEIAKRTAGRITLQQFPDSTLGGDVELMKGVQLGSIDLAFVTGMGIPSVLPELGVLNIPFLFNGVPHAHAVLDGPIGESFRARFAAKDLVLLGWGENGLRHITNSKRPIVTPDDLKGLKMRVPQSEVLLMGFQALGVDTASLPFPQLFEALRAGKFDGQENPIATIQAAKFDQVQKFLTLSGHAYDPAAFVMSPDAFDELSAEDKASFADAARAGGLASRKFAADAQTAGVAALQQAGMTVQISIDRGRFASAMAGANAEFEKRFGRDLIERIRQAG
ncbi:MAG: DctP family TRAP transporter solute-binding subunit [Acetobacteraceae bacterium]|jgi:TRAP-type transport system periplasmic protein